MEVLVGVVRVNEDWEGESYRDYMEVVSLQDIKDTLDDRLLDYDGKIVKITVEVVETN